MKNGDWRINRSPSMTYEAKKEFYKNKRLEVINALGDKCCRCNFDDLRVLQIDHINGGGSQERKTKSGTSYLYHVLKNLSKYQLLCANCNWIKRYEEDPPQIGNRQPLKG
ncbi:MAG: hypothetical protein PHY47_00055 [Lachnospiraceae bacterium]|nr:hypothetical protein [Lachnospiraceae bacterium]